MIMHKKSTVYYPQANGQAESTNKTLQNILKKIVDEDRKDWDQKLSSALWAYRSQQGRRYCREKALQDFHTTNLRFFDVFCDTFVLRFFFENSEKA